MKFISEEAIELAATALETSEEAFEEAINEMQEKQPVLLGYYFSENFQPFTQAEKEYMLFLALVVWKAVEDSTEHVPRVEEEAISKAEDDNWEQFMNHKSKDFRARLTPFFEQYPQEDLLAFVEDALIEDEEDEVITTEGRAALFISLKTGIDCLTGVYG